VVNLSPEFSHQQKNKREALRVKAYNAPTPTQSKNSKKCFMLFVPTASWKRTIKNCFCPSQAPFPCARKSSMYDRTTVVDPRAVMIHLYNAPPTGAAMMRSRRLDTVALGADPPFRLNRPVRIALRRESISSGRLRHEKR
jgi:hypothetical protein